MADPMFPKLVSLHIPFESVGAILLSFLFFCCLLPATRALHGQAAKGFLAAAAVAACAAPRRPQVPAAELSLDDLNGEQQAVVHAVLKGHNVFLTGGQWQNCWSTVGASSLLFDGGRLSD